MKTPRTKLILAVLALSLSVNLCFLLFNDMSPVMAAAPIRYKAVRIKPNTEAIQAALDQYGTEGWQLVAVEASIGHLIFRK